MKASNLFVAGLLVIAALVLLAYSTHLFSLVPYDINGITYSNPVINVPDVLYQDNPVNAQFLSQYQPDFTGTETITPAYNVSLTTGEQYRYVYAWFLDGQLVQLYPDDAGSDQVNVIHLPGGIAGPNVSVLSSYGFKVRNDSFPDLSTLTYRVIPGNLAVGQHTLSFGSYEFQGLYCGAYVNQANNSNIVDASLCPIYNTSTGATNSVTSRTRDQAIASISTQFTPIATKTFSVVAIPIPAPVQQAQAQQPQPPAPPSAPTTVMQSPASPPTTTTNNTVASNTTTNNPVAMNFKPSASDNTKYYLLGTAILIGIFALIFMGARKR